MTADPPANAKLTRGEICYLFRSFIVLWIVLVFGNMIFGLIVMRPQLKTDSNTLTRDSANSSFASDGWPSKIPDSMSWPEPDKLSTYQTPAGFVNAVLATAWDSDSTNYVMDVIRTGTPWITFESKKTSVVRRGQVLHRSPPAGQAPRLSIKPIGVLINSGLYAIWVWFFIGFLPVAHRQSTRRLRHKAWIKSAMCGVCGYDILDLPICPECGTPSHKFSVEIQDQAHEPDRR